MSLQIKVKKHNNKLKMNRSEGITNFNGEINKRNSKQRITKSRVGFFKQINSHMYTHIHTLMQEKQTNLIDKYFD